MYSFFCYLHDNKTETDMCWIRQGLNDDNNLRMKVEYKIETIYNCPTIWVCACKHVKVLRATKLP
jgi:hypothetical protein